MIDVRCHLGILAVAGSMLVGCSAAAEGPSDPFPPRPQPIEVMAIDPCRVLTPEQLASRGLTPEDRNYAEPVVGGDTTYACGWGNSWTADFSYSAQMMPVDAASAVGGPGSQVRVIAGYGAVRNMVRENTSPMCELVVDAADGRVMRLQVQVIGLKPDGSTPSIDETCREAERLGVDALGTARTLTP
ncbi:DUF3558 family protein [Pseudonocardia saturnea]|uniref:DUF3558 domain-containing protein n=3 Tax=Pseudonocardia TaxID=1847 RepID=A0A1Y2MLL7_PSEAH|nr:DUF3558 family protein [Pseudonocardia saturnea]OSY36186.1 hypothetical protein BG845_05584 [Pseudonocardia autotrophica]TDN76619.1 uncharacterized protein DUF3558 [Pseudonocardia autotrophica]BBG00619.1 hypothetical protein Pdca_18280 [Pseudonocardia autotrophica]GEC27003.1 hypothetical protein PSA01_40320 [Pseudonocardia saturnea]